MNRTRAPRSNLARWTSVGLVALVTGGMAACELALGIEPGELGDPNAGAAGAGLPPGGAGGEGGGTLPESCQNDEQDGTETDVDCGGELCLACENGQNCASWEDCVSHHCQTDVTTPVCLPCGDDGDCQPLGEAFCDRQTSICTGVHENGEPCSARTECQSEFCVDGVCCDDLCAGGCDRCDWLGQEGTCTMMADGDPGDGSCAPYLCDGVWVGCPATCAGPEDCNENSYCDATNHCQGTNPNGTACVNDGECVNGHCVDDVCCDDADCPGACNACNVPGSLGACATAPPGFPCDDGIFCNGPDFCVNGGLCDNHQGDPCPGPDPDADCSESCDEAEGDCTANDPVGSTCSDDQFCTASDTCDASGTCIGGTDDPCAAAYSDSNCYGGCNEGTNSCSNGTPEPEGSPCDDYSFCNGTGTCNATGSCSANSGDPCNLADANCTQGCNESSNNCSYSYEPNGSSCDDGNFCNGPDTCNSSGGCSGHDGDPCPGPDGDADCNESCNGNAEDCTAYDGNGEACDDLDYCNGTDQCNSGTCAIHTGDPCDGPDDDTNCWESCDPAGSCDAYDGNGASCGGDGRQCNGGNCV